MPRLTQSPLPQEIQAVITYEDGYYIAELPSYEAVTQARTIQELVFLVNDLICALFDIPASKQEGIWYKPSHATVMTDPTPAMKPTRDTYRLLGRPLREDVALHA